MKKGYEHEAEKQLELLKQRQEFLRYYAPNQKIGSYLKKCHEAIEVAEAASEMFKCDWGTQCIKGTNIIVSPPIIEIRPPRTIADRFRALERLLDGVRDALQTDALPPASLVAQNDFCTPTPAICDITLTLTVRRCKTGETRS